MLSSSPRPRLVWGVGILVLFLMGLSSTNRGTTLAQEPKSKAADKTKRAPLPRIAMADPAEAAKDPDFAVQGEYEGICQRGSEAEERYGAQIVAEGNGQFLLVLHRGGLPGAGAKGPRESIRQRRPAASESLQFLTSLKETIRWTPETLRLESEDGQDRGRLKRVTRVSPTLGAKPPANAEVLFAGPDDTTRWDGGRLVTLSDGSFLNNGIKSKTKYQSFEAHVEFRTPWMPNSRGQGRGNSGVYLQDRYEIQVLDSFGLAGENNECGGIYTQYKPLANLCLPPLSWQTYDIHFQAATFDAQGKKTAPAKLTLRHNGVLIHDQVELKGSTGGGQTQGPTPGPFQLQNHGDPVVYKNVWVIPK